RLARSAAPTDAARESQRVLLRLRSARRHAAARETLRHASDVGERNRIRRPADQAAKSGPDGGGNESLSVSGWRDQLVLAVIQPRDRSLLRADVRKMQRLHEER